MTALALAAVAALDLRDVSTFPTRRVEAWRYSDFRRVVDQAVPTAGSFASEIGPGPFASIEGDDVVFANGRTREGETSTRIDSAGGVVRLRFVSDAVHAGWQASAEVVVSPGAHLVVLESYEGHGSAYVASAALTFTLGPGASLERIVLLDERADAVCVSAADVALSAGSRFDQTVMLTGARLQRHETRVRHPGEGAAVRMDGVYLLDGSRHGDLTTVVVHEAADGETSQVVKGVVSDQARGVFQGRIVVSEGADRTDARMRHDTLLLSDRAEVDAKPELEIYADDVACAHGNTVGALDADALFYMRARGLTEAAAAALLLRAHFGEVVERIGHERAREIVADWIEQRLERLG